MEDDDEHARRERAERLRAEIEALRSGDEEPPSSPREFVERRAREQPEDQAEASDRDPPRHGGASA